MSVKPEPKTITVICTACGLPWEAHGPEPTLETCVGLLKAELAKRPSIRGVFPAPSAWTYPSPGRSDG